MAFSDFQAWKTKYYEWLAAETSGGTLSDENNSFVEPIILQSEAFMGESIYSPSATIAYKTAHNRVQAHRRDFPCLRQNRAMYHEEQAADETMTIQLLDEFEAVLMRMVNFREMLPMQDLE